MHIYIIIYLYIYIIPGKGVPVVVVDVVAGLSGVVGHEIGVLPLYPVVQDGHRHAGPAVPSIQQIYYIYFIIIYTESTFYSVVSF